MEEKVSIAYCFDREYAQYAAVSTLSLLSNTPLRAPIYWCIDQTIVRDVEDLLSRSGLGDLGDIRIVPLDGAIFSDWNTTLHMSASTYYRLLLPALLPEPKILYLDSDTLIVSSVIDLLKVELGNRLFAGVADVFGGRSSRVPRAGNDTYINAGVLLVNAAQLRQMPTPFLDQCKSVYIKHKEELTWLDQCLINKVSEKRKIILDQQWNLQIKSNDLTLEESIAVSKECVGKILHFVGSVKPWQQWCNPLASKIWWSYAKRFEKIQISETRIERIQEALMLADILDKVENYREASHVKGQILKAVLKN